MTQKKQKDLFKIGDSIRDIDTGYIYKVLEVKWENYKDCYLIISENNKYPHPISRDYVHEYFTLVKEESEKKYEIKWV